MACIEVTQTDDPLVGFKDADALFLVGSVPRKEGMLRKELLHINARIFEVQGKAINEVAKTSVKVLVVGNPANTNALIAQSFAPRIPASNFSALTRLDENRAKAQVTQCSPSAGASTQMVLMPFICLVFSV